MRKLLIIVFSFSLCEIIYAQGWLIDEVSKDDSGGIFSGVFGFLILLGLVWLVGNIIDKKKEDSERHKRSTNKHIFSSAELNDESSKPRIRKSDKNAVFQEREEKQDKEVTELIPKNDSCYIYYRVIKGKDYADFSHYSTMFKDGYAVESYSIRNNQIDKNEYQGVNIKNVKEKGNIISKEEFEKWKKRIDIIKLKLDHLFPGHKIPYGKEWKNGDYFYFPAGEVLAELNKKFADNYYLEESTGYHGPDFSLLHVTNADKESPEGFHISVSENYISYDNEEDGPESLGYYIPYYDRMCLISQEEYEKALTMIKNEFKAIMQDIKTSTNKNG